MRICSWMLAGPKRFTGVSLPSVWIIMASVPVVLVNTLYLARSPASM